MKDFNTEAFLNEWLSSCCNLTSYEVVPDPWKLYRLIGMLLAKFQ